MIRALTLLFLLAIPCALGHAETLSINPGKDRPDNWALLSKSATLGKDELVLDGRTEQSMAIFKGAEWADLKLTAKFRLDPAPRGVLACGFVFRAMDEATYYYVHFDRTWAILVLSSPEVSWNEVRRVSGLNKPAGQWHGASIEAQGGDIQVSLNGKLLFQAKDQSLKKGHIGFYANQGIAHVKDIVVSGRVEDSDKKFKRRPPLVGFVVKDAGAGGYEAFPDVCRLDDGRLMCVYYAGYTHVSLPNEKYPLGGRVCCSFSADEGMTWSKPSVLFDGPNGDRDPSVVHTERTARSSAISFPTCHRRSRASPSSLWVPFCWHPRTAGRPGHRPG